MNNNSGKQTAALASFIAGLVILSFSNAIAAEIVMDQTALKKTVSPDEPEDKWKPPYRGSMLTYRNITTAISLNRDAQLSYNPYYAMALSMRPRWWLGDVFNTSLGLTIMRELTDSDWTTESGEVMLSDLVLSAGASRFATIPVLEIDFSLDLGFIAPTSKASKARTMILGIKPGLSLSRAFDVLSGIGLSYRLGLTKTFYHSTTAQKEEPAISGCLGASGGCEPYMNTGVRNASWGLANTFGASIWFLEWLGISSSVTLMHGFLFEQENIDSDYEISQGVGGYDDTDVRYTMIYNLEITARPMPALAIALGADTANPQLAPDSTYREPFFNRYTAIYLDLRLDFAGLASQLSSK